MNAEIITIGDEILIGQVVDTNSAFIGKELTKIGIEVNQIKSIKDEPAHIAAALKEAATRADLVLITGGLGPTRDDKTKAVFCNYFKDYLVVNQSALANVKRLFARIKEPVLPVNLDQAKVPSQAVVLPNKYGTAPGMWFEKDGVVYVSMPGVPYEMKALMTDEVIPQLMQKFNRPYILQKTVLTYGMGESRLAEKIKNWEDRLPSYMSLAYLPAPGRVRLRLTARGNEQAVLQKALDEHLQALELLIGNLIGGYEGESSLQEEIAQQLTYQRQTLATVESCTGGKIAAMFTEIPGASAYFKGSLVPYSSRVKEEVLGVSEDLIKEHSVVSELVVKAMATRAQQLFKVDYVVATTGNAGPTKGDSDAEIGTVFVAIATPQKVITQEFHLGKLREKVVNKAIYRALMMLKEQIKA